MIVPTNKLLTGSLLALAPGAAAFAVAPQLLLFAGLGLLIFLLVVILDLNRALAQSRAWEARFETAQRLVKDREENLHLILKKPKAYSGELRIGLILPPSFSSQEDYVSTKLSREAEEVKLPWRCTPRKRGRFLIKNIYFETLSPWSYWRCQQRSEASAELRVYPNLIPERNRLAALFLHRGGLGMHTQRRIGKGRDFEQLRDYMAGDSYEDIHWKATARRGHPVTKMYQIERTQEVYVVIDASRLSARALSDNESGEIVSQLDRFITAALVLGLAAEKQGDRFGLLTFGSQVKGFIGAQRGKAHFNACRDSLYLLESEAVHPDYDEVFSFIRTRLRRRALLIFLTNLDDPILAESFSKNLRLINRRHLVLVNMLTPPKVQPLFQEEAIDTDTELYQQLAGHLQWRDLRALQRDFHHHGVSLSLQEHASLAPQLVNQYMNVKQRQIL